MGIGITKILNLNFHVRDIYFIITFVIISYKDKFSNMYAGFKKKIQNGVRMMEQK